MPKNAQKTKQQIIATLGRLKKANVTEVIKNLPEKKSRAWVSALLNMMVKNKELVRSKVGKHIYYTLPENIELLAKQIKKKLRNEGLNEDLVFDEMKEESVIFEKLDENTTSILRYGFTEMLNNAIEHSKSKDVEAAFKEINGKLLFEVRDFGIGVFKNIMGKRGLKSELEAIQDLLKGKTTTLPHSHSGEGIFFTSKIADVFMLDSFEYRLRVDNTLPDIFVEKIDSVKGTKVQFEIDKSSSKHLSDVFHEYEAEPDSFSFDKTKVHVKLFKAGNVYVSRSQARRLMANLEKFKLIILDFEDIETIGQAFADEIFRVFLSNHPDIKVEAINISETVKFMIDRVAKPQLPFLPEEK